MGSGFAKMRKQARLLEEQFEKMQQDKADQEIVGTSGAGLVTAVFSGTKELKKITIRPDCVNPEDVEGLQDLILAACQDAYKHIEAQSENIPSQFAPFL